MNQILLALFGNGERKQLTEERFEIRCTKTVAMLEDVAFKQNFRVTRSGFQKLYTELAPHITEGTTRYAISKETKLLLTLRHLAQGSYQLGVGNDVHVCVLQSLVSQIVNKLLNVMNVHFCPKYVVFPSFARMTTTATAFHHKFGIPNVIGLIDGTHVKIVFPPTKDPAHPEFVYVNRKHFHSINATVICDHENRFTYVNARYPGSAHDSFVWRFSDIRQHLLQNYRGENVWLLGDSGYPNEPVLLTPYEDGGTAAKELFNEKHTQCRSGVERCIGILKARWRCLRQERGLHYHPTVAGKIINACVALHNFCVDMDDDYVNIDPDDEPEVPTPNFADDSNAALMAAGKQIRDNVANYLVQAGL